MKTLPSYSFSYDGDSLEKAKIPDAINHLRFHLSEDNKTLDVVGFISFSDKENQQHLHVILPKHYPCPSDGEKEETARFLLRTLLKFRHRHFELWKDAVVQGELTGDSFFVEMEFIIRDWKTYGLLRRKHRKFTQKGVGRVDWQRTLHRVQPMFSHGSPVYYPPVMAVRDATQDELIQRIHAYVVWSILQCWGGLFGAQWEGVAPNRPALDKEMIHSLRRELRGCFVEREKELLRAMIGYLEAQDGFGKKNTSQTFLVKFELIWEDICGDILDNQHDRLKDILPHAVYESEEGESWPVAPPNPDILCEKNNSIYIFDAKYYDKAPPFYCEPCMKQFMYAYLIGGLIEKNRQTVAANVFLLPSDNEKDSVMAGKISLANSSNRDILMECFSKLGAIIVLHVPIKKMMEEYVMGQNGDESMKRAIFDTLC